MKVGWWNVGWRPTKQQLLKKEIRRRLTTEDYTCRLPRDPKPRVRYRLRKVRVWGIGSILSGPWVYK